ncbi:MAG: glycosyltransferase [Thermoguttaceae bacterium]|nr:glycosyltransferase [Thermoguttaceae bacterium]
MDNKPVAIYVCPGDPWGSPRGGQTSFARQALNAFRGTFAVVSPCETGSIPIGRWIVDDWRGERIWRFNLGSYAPTNKSKLPIIPRRVVFRGLIKKYLPAIRTIKTRNLFCDSPEILDVLCQYSWESTCYRFAGLNNPIAFSRYRHLRFLADWFHRRTMKYLSVLSPEACLASADRMTIAKFEEENAAVIPKGGLKFFPTRYDSNVFFPGNAQTALRNLGWENRYPRLSIVGRLCWIKGWSLALEALKIIKKRFPRVLLSFVGDGEDRAKLESKVSEFGLSDNVRIDGFLKPEDVCERLVASDLYLVASIREGWSVALVEALACGKVVVSTEVSGTRDMVVDGVNGVVVSEREPSAFADAIEKALSLVDSQLSPLPISVEISNRFSQKTLAEDWANLWTPLRKGVAL